MPCTDVTETIRLTFDRSDRLQNYELRKQTCGAVAGSPSLLMPWVTERTPEEILELRLDTPQMHSAASSEQDFVYDKHLRALQESVRAFLGLAPSGLGADCVVIHTHYDEQGIEFFAQIHVPVLTEKIDPCGHCGSCAKDAHS